MSWEIFRQEEPIHAGMISCNFILSKHFSGGIKCANFWFHCSMNPFVHLNVLVVQVHMPSYATGGLRCCLLSLTSATCSMVCPKCGKYFKLVHRGETFMTKTCVWDVKMSKSAGLLSHWDPNFPTTCWWLNLLQAPILKLGNQQIWQQLGFGLLIDHHILHSPAYW